MKTARSNIGFRSGKASFGVYMDQTLPDFSHAAFIIGFAAVRTIRISGNIFGQIRSGPGWFFGRMIGRIWGF
jgi:hypothetical protein